MCCNHLRLLALLAMVFVAWPSLVSATDELQQPQTSTAGDDIEPRHLSASGVQQLGYEESVEADSKPGKTGKPTPAKRNRTETPTPQDEIAPQSEPIAETAKSKSADESLHPIPDPMESGPVTLEAASFQGVIPGVSTKDDVTTTWGQPKEIAKQDGEVVELYSVAPFNHVEVTYAGEKVASLLVRFERAFPAETVAKQLDLSTIRPVLVSNELGEVLGLAYPERGVLFSFEPSGEPGKASMKVAQLALEPITAEPFVLRAENLLETRCDLCRRDLEQAMALDPDNARAHWLYSRVLVTMGQNAKAVKASARAVELDPENATFLVTYAQMLAQAGQLTEALAEAKKAVEQSADRPHVKARALCLVGDLTASGPKPDFRRAIALHTESIQLADTLASDSHPAIRLAAKEVLIDAHLGAAHDIAWGDWKEKNKAVARWLDRAVAVADDLVKNEGGSKEQALRVYIRAMAAYAGLRGGVDPEPTVNAIVDTGNDVIAAAREPARKAQLQWNLGMALYDAVQISQVQSNYPKALEYGKLATEYLSTAYETIQTPEAAFLLGRLHFRMGTIHAMGEKDHAAAVACYEKAIPLLAKPSAEDLAANLGRQGEAFVSMGVSYWEVGQQKKAVELSEKGIAWMEQAVKQGSLKESALTVPYNNLSAMHRKLGSATKAERFQELANRLKSEKVK